MISEPGLAYGAAVSWCQATNDDINMAAALSTHVFEDPTGRLADAVLALGDAHLLVAPQFPNMSTLVMNLYYPQLAVGRGLTAGLTAADLDTVENCLADARSTVANAQAARQDGKWLVDEVVYSADLVSLFVRDAQARLRGDGTLGSVGPDELAALGSALDELMERLRSLWLRRNRPGGLEDSLAWLRNVRAAYSSGRPDPNWGGISVPQS